MTRLRETPGDRRKRRAAVEDPAVVVEAAARFLEARPRSVAEVRRRLASAGYRADLVEVAVARMTDLGFLDDETFARAWVESRDRARPRSERAIREELRVKGVDRAIVDAVLEERRAGEQTVDDRAAERLLAKHDRSLGRVADPRLRRQRAFALLARNGFPPDVCSRVATAFLADAAASATPAEAGVPDEEERDPLESGQ
jgi:regulatory protein